MPVTPTSALNDAQAFQAAARLDSNRVIQVDARADNQIGTFSNSMGTRAIKWVKATASSDIALHRGEKVAKTHERLLNAIAATQIRHDERELAMVKTLLMADAANSKPLTSFRVREVLGSLSGGRAEHVLESRVAIKNATTDDFLKSKIIRQLQTHPKFRNMKDTGVMLSEFKISNLQKGIQDSLKSTLSGQGTPITKDQAVTETERHVAFAVDKLAKLFPDTPIHTVSPDGYSRTIEGDFKALKDNLGWNAKALDIENAARSLKKAVGGFGGGIASYKGIISQEPTDQNYHMAVGRLDKLIGALDKTINDYFRSQRHLPVTLKKEDVAGIERLKHSLESEKKLLLNCAEQYRKVDSETGEVRWDTEAKSIHEMTVSARFPDKVEDLESAVRKYQFLLSEKAVTQPERPPAEQGKPRPKMPPPQFSLDGTAALNVALDDVERAALSFYKAAQKSPLVDADKIAGPLLDAVDKERRNITLLVQNPLISNRGETDFPLASALHNRTRGDILNMSRTGLEYGPHMKPETPHLPREAQNKLMGMGGVNVLTQVNFVDGNIKVFKPEQFAIQQGADSRIPKIMAEDYKLPLEQPRSAARNIATSNVADALGVDHLVVRSEYYQSATGSVGSLQEKAKGGPLYDQYTKTREFKDPTLLTNPKFLQDLNMLQWLDALTMQADRHDANIFIDHGAGGYKGIKGIDNDFSFGTKEVALKDVKARMSGPDWLNPAAKTYGYNAGLPPLIDKSVYDRLMSKEAPEKLLQAVDGLLTTEELLRYRQRIEEIITHAKQLRANGRVVGLGADTWGSFKAPNPSVIGGQLSAFQLSADPTNSYYGRMLKPI